MDIGSINAAWQTLSRLRQISKSIEHAEFRGLLADLSVQLSDAKVENAALKEKVASLMDALAKKQNAAKAREPYKLQWGCAKFEGDDHMLYCVRCYEREGRKHPTSRVDSRFRMCTVCSNRVSAS
jgi:hypothetical protein